MARALDEAFALAALGPGHGPNPRVGCVLLDSRGTIGRGTHRGAGHPHAEVEALHDAARQGHAVRGATAVVTLEPCAHTGRTGPCAAALAEAGVARVVFAASDPNPQAAGGAKYLRARGIDVMPDADPSRARDLNLAWWHAITTGRP
ncbi:MAG: riboflavin biosynthesis protein RibD, partial [Bifidobacteriaceae bacterium]|nr:riboflavin biosynthesis protein RibD [Bifidobacteriaceae bacterium]